MGMMLRICDQPAYLHVVATGEFSLGEAKRTFLEILEAASRHKAGKVLVDTRGLAGDVKTMERFYYAEFAARAVAGFADRGVSRSTSFAYVAVEPMLDPQRFGETVAVNRGMCVKAFDNLDGALRWLGIESAEEPGLDDG